jgi:TolA-binding protein
VSFSLQARRCCFALLVFPLLLLAAPRSSAQELLVSVRERSGGPLSVEAIVRVTSLTRGQTMVSTTGNIRTGAGTASFSLTPGEYEIEVEAAGYDKGAEHASIANETAQTVYVFLSPVDASTPHTAAAGVVLTPAVQRELDKSLIALRQSKFDDARKHLEKARKMAPSSPDILYLMGMLDYTAKNLPAARKDFEAVLATNPTHERSLLMLGQMQLEANENKEARSTLEKAIDADSTNWRAHYLLALALVRSGELPRAETEAARAGDLNKEKAPSMRLLRAKILMAEGKNSEAEPLLRSFLKDYPTNDGAAEAKKYLDTLEEAKKAAVAAPVLSSPDPLKPADAESAAAIAAAFAKPWAPPDIDAAVPPTAPGISCSTEDVLHNAQQRILRQLADLEKFSATETVEHQFMDSNGVWTTPESREFDYLIFVHHSQTLPYYFDEDRNGAESLYSFPTTLATRGLVSLGFMVVHPVFSKDFQFTCEGLGSWNGQPAWQIHFVQRSGVPSRIRTWTYHKEIFPIPLKGRIWISANKYNILHLDTALREQVSGLRLNREQLSVDYGPVRFDFASTTLWLPWHAEMYFDLMGRRYHHKHTLTKYLVFGVDTKNKIAVPSPPSEPEDN